MVQTIDYQFGQYPNYYLTRFATVIMEWMKTSKTKCSITKSPKHNSQKQNTKDFKIPKVPNVQSPIQEILKGLFAKNERGYRLYPIKKRF